MVIGVWGYHPAKVAYFFDSCKFSPPSYSTYIYNKRLPPGEVRALI